MRIKFVPKDIWIGLYYDRQIMWRDDASVTTTYYLCLLPCLPIIWETHKVLSLDDAMRRYCYRVGESWFEKSGRKAVTIGGKP